MKKRNLKKRVTSLLCTTLIVAGITGGIAAGSSIYVQADTIDELFQQREDLTKQEKELEEQKKKMEEEKKKTEEEVKQLEEQLKALVDEINKLDAHLSELMGRIFEVNRQLEEQKAKQSKQYEEMKLRIRYMYEDSNHNMSEALVSSGDMKQALNAAEYFQRIYSYDRSRLDEIKDTREKIEELQSQLQSEFDEVKKAEEEMAAKRTQVAEIATQKKDKISGLSADIAATVNSIADTQQAFKDTNEALQAEIRAKAGQLNGAQTEELIKFARRARESSEGYDAGAKNNLIAELASTNKGTFPCTAGWCAAWVSGVYNAAGVLPPHGNAIDYWNKWQSTGSTSMKDIPVGAAVISSGAGYEGSIYGHIGIYIGGGLVASNIGYCKIETVESFGASATANCQGHTGYIGWVWPNGIVLGK